MRNIAFYMFYDIHICLEKMMMDRHDLGDLGEIIPSNDTYFEDNITENKNKTKCSLCNLI